MKTKAIILSIVLVAGYTFLLENWNDREEHTLSLQGELSINAINAQRFLYDFSKEDYNCILGSSLSTYLQSERLPSHFYNLAFTGQSVSDGLEVLKFKDVLPDTLFIEINYLSKHLNRDFLKKIVNSEEEVKLKQEVLLFQEKNVPMGIAANVIEYYFSENTGSIRNKYVVLMHIIKNKIDRFTGSNDNLNSPVFTAGAENTVLSLPDKSDHMLVFENVARQLKKLEKDSVTLVFFEMPVDCALENNAKFSFSREAVRKAFLPSDYMYIASGSCENFKTSDGLHLDRKSSESFTSYFVSEISKMRE